ncbi:hypothetical protein [Frisingicoccus sp.]|uniref:hypothetical protein n=1 Tax=Frisingicoccus sp. TaxID=1918627 RepID=UPI002A809290|nr:hypothetical protein [Frisingicoccus sp.]MDY4922018.1 hypothetical protein [Frisingicoccus sp.]
MEENLVLLDQEQLRLLLKSNASKIGNTNGWEPFITAFIFFISSAFATYQPWWIFSAGIFKGLVVLISCILMIRGIYLAVKDRKYTYMDLYTEMKNQNQIKHPFSIVVVKNEFEQYPDRFLVYYDSRWKCRLFLNFRTQQDMTENEEKIKRALSNELQVDMSDIKIDYKNTYLHKKFSYSDQCEKWYEHTIYQAHISHMPETEQSDSFVINGRQYFWMSLPEMERDQIMMEKNSDIVSFVKQLVI